MSIKLHIICGMCGSADVDIKVEDHGEDGGGQQAVFRCGNCATLTTGQDHNEYIAEVKDGVSRYVW